MKNLLVLGAIGLGLSSASGQNMLGISTSRYGGTNRLYINPALAADSPSRVFLNGATGNIHLNNNYVRYQAPFSLLRLVTNKVPAQYRNADGSVRFQESYTQEINDGRPKNGTLAGEVRGPAILVKTSDYSAFAVTTRFRGIVQVMGASEALLSSLRASLSDGALYGIPSRNNQLSVNTNTYAELAFTYASILIDGDGQKLLAGATVKGLLGYNAQHFINNGLTYRVTADAATPNMPYLEVTQLDATLGYTTYLQNRGISPRTLISSDIPGIGVGADIGLTYISQYDRDSPSFRLGAAVTDIGGISYKGQDYVYTSAQLERNPIRFQGSDFNNIGGTLDLAQTVQEKLSAGRTADRTRFSAGLPTSLNLTADYTDATGTGISLTYLQDLRSIQAQAVHQSTLVAVTPHFDKRWLSLSLPVVYLNRGVSVGASVRVGPAWLGTDNFLGLFGNSANGIRPRGLDVYGGLAFGIGRADNDE